MSFRLRLPEGEEPSDLHVKHPAWQLLPAEQRALGVLWKGRALQNALFVGQPVAEYHVFTWVK